ncbi:unnamed protein product, partial [Musa textilis]
MMGQAPLRGSLPPLRPGHPKPPGGRWRRCGRTSTSAASPRRAVHSSPLVTPLPSRRRRLLRQRDHPARLPLRCLHGGGSDPPGMPPPPRRPQPRPQLQLRQRRGLLLLQQPQARRLRQCRRQAEEADDEEPGVGRPVQGQETGTPPGLLNP